MEENAIVPSNYRWLGGKDSNLDKQIQGCHTFRRQRT